MARHLGRGSRDGNPGMPRVSFIPAAVRDLEHLHAFLQPKSPAAARRAAAVIAEAVRGVGQHRGLGRPVEEMPLCRELLIEFGDSGYVALYRHEGDHVIVLPLRHQREAGYRPEALFVRGQIAGCTQT